MTYEEAFRRLEEITRALESGETELAESVRLYDEGRKLLELCDNQLKNARQIITQTAEAGEEPKA